MSAPDPIRVFWQPGCSSCLAAKEFLKSREVPFESVNVLASSDAMAELAALGVRTVPVVARGSDYVLAQDLDELARFVGVVFERDRLTPAQMVERLHLLLDADERFVMALPQEALGTALRGREDRTWLSLAYHISVIPEAFIDAAEGGELSYAYYERMPPAAVKGSTDVAACYRAIRDRLGAWWAASGQALPDTVRTYYGEAPAATVLERTTWHVAQHSRQLESLVTQSGGDPSPGLGDAELGGLPLPGEVWDDEVAMTAA